MELNLIFNEFINAFYKNPLSQSFWIFAYLITLFTFIFLKDKKFILWNLVNSVFWWLHYQFLWLFLASFINYFDVLKNWFALKYERKKWFFYIFIVAYLLIWIFTYKDIYSLFPTFAVLFSTFLVFFVRWLKLKLWFSLVLLCWLVYNIHAMSIGWILSDTTLFISLIIWVAKDYISEKRLKIIE
jgi:hypothetical protein